MINFSRHNDKVKACVQYKSGDIDTNLFFYWDCKDAVTAEALSKQLQQFQWDSVEKALRESYEVGYKDGRGKKVKRSWFSPIIKHINHLEP